MRGTAAGLVALALLAGCGGGGSPERTLDVFAAASLTETFGELERQFEAANPGVDVVVNYGASSDLAQQIVHGGPADVFAAASQTTMATVTDAGLVAGAPTVFATNTLQIVTLPGNPTGIASFADLARPGLSVVVCAPQVPCGAVVEQIERATGVTLSPVSEEPDVKSTLGKVTTGNADAGLVYVTDVEAAGPDVQGVPFPESARAATNYPIAVLADAPQPDLARAFQELVTGEAGRSALTAAGFGVP
jgi:molybdate transport system substrate-binding protein